MIEAAKDGAKSPTYGPEAQRRLRLATYFAAFIIFITPPIRSGWLELTSDILAGGSLLGLPFFLALNAYGFFFALFPMGLFLMWSWPRADPLGLPPRSTWLLGLLLAYLPIQLIYEPQFKSDEVLERTRMIDEMLPAVPIIRQLDKPVLLLVAVWAWWRRQVMGPAERLAFHFLLFLCLIWAICETIDVGFGSSLLER